jgi:hypothetical protein
MNPNIKMDSHRLSLGVEKQARFLNIVFLILGFEQFFYRQDAMHFLGIEEMLSQDNNRA